MRKGTGSAPESPSLILLGIATMCRRSHCRTPLLSYGHITLIDCLSGLFEVGLKPLLHQPSLWKSVSARFPIQDHDEQSAVSTSVVHSNPPNTGNWQRLASRHRRTLEQAVRKPFVSRALVLSTVRETGTVTKGVVNLSSVQQ